MSVQSESGRVDYHKSDTGPRTAMVAEEKDKPVWIPLPPDSETPLKSYPALGGGRGQKIKDEQTRKKQAPLSWKDIE